MATTPTVAIPTIITHDQLLQTDIAANNDYTDDTTAAINGGMVTVLGDEALSIAGCLAARS